jgi:hypothetical protein
MRISSEVKVLLGVLKFGILLALILIAAFLFGIFWQQKFHAPLLNPTDTVLVLGHSQVENAIVDLPYPADQIINLGASGEDYFYTYLKAKALLSSANNITRAYISISNERFESRRDTIAFNRSNLDVRWWKFLPFAGIQEWSILYEKSGLNFLYPCVFFLRNQLSLALTDRESIPKKFAWGGFRANYSNGLDSMMNANQGKSYPISFAVEPNLSFEYLKKLVGLFQSKGIKVVLFRIPMHPAYPPLQNELFFQKAIQTHFPATPFLDFQNIPMSNAHFADQCHLNPSGTERFMVYFLSSIQGVPVP